jgi:3-methylcrotonyl-CoA carboxylase alpha subunit
MSNQKIHHLFIANRGEIACRIVRTAHRLRIKTSGVYTLQDSQSKHPRILDHAICVPPGGLKDTYLNGELLIATALEIGAEAVHPGYGFLAENPGFAERVLQAGLIWIGPHPDAMRKVGDKISAKQIARNAGIPVTSWWNITSQPAEREIEEIVQKIGLPILIKAVHGGGGRGQRVVRDKKDFAENLRTAQSEAERSFGSREVFVERFLEQPRHIEVQILSDHHGNIFSFGERDCTLQRRNQKLIEETPASILDEAAREYLINAAKVLAKEAAYSNAGTVEFLAQKSDSGKWEFFFMELNARLQVEHPVTEMVWGIDLVELQLRVAEGENLKDQPELTGKVPAGHAIELRLCAEDPQNHFLPTPGPITEFALPETIDNISFRLDSGFETGDVVPQEYDSLFAKLIVCSGSREKTLNDLRKVLERCRIAGLLTNKYFLQDVVSHPDFEQNRIFTRWIDSHPELTQNSTVLDSDLQYWGKRMSSELLVQRRQRQIEPEVPQELTRPSILIDFAPRAGDHGGNSPQGLIRIAGDFTLAQNAGTVYASGWISRFEICLAFDRVIHGIGQRRISFAGQFEVEDPRAHHGPIVAQVPGVVLDVRAKVNQVVQAQEPILVIEAMKIEMPMTLPINAKITSIHVKAGDRIQPGQTLVTWEPAA